MEYKLITTNTEMQDLAESWNALLDSNATQVPFLRYEYQQTWWKTLGGGEWKQADLSIVAAYQDKQLVGIAPLFFTRNQDNTPALMLIGSIEVSDYLDVIAGREILPEFIDGLFDFLASDEAPPWQILDWCNILENSPTLPAMENAARRMDWEYGCERLQHSPHILLPGDWDEYLARLDKKQRHEIRRKLRRMNDADVPFRVYTVQDKEALEAESNAFIELMAQDKEKAEFLTPPMREFMRDVIRCAFDADCLQLAFIEIDGKKAAGYLNFKYLNRTWVYNSGLSYQFNEYSPGWVLLAHLLMQANEDHIDDFDFMRGNEDYKYRFGAVDRYVVRAFVRR